MTYARGITVDASGVVYFADGFESRIRKITPDGKVHFVSGTSGGFAGDGGPAALVRMSGPHGIAAHPSGSLYFADSYNRRVRRISSGGVIRHHCRKRHCRKFRRRRIGPAGKFQFAGKPRARERQGLRRRSGQPPGAHDHPARGDGSSAPVIGEALAGSARRRLFHPRRQRWLSNHRIHGDFHARGRRRCGCRHHQTAPPRHRARQRRQLPVSRQGQQCHWPQRELGSLQCRDAGRRAGRPSDSRSRPAHRRR